jgi:hypothetical protein
MSQSDRVPRLGEIVLYHEAVRQDIWEKQVIAAWPAIVTEVLPPRVGDAGPRLRLTAFRPFDKPMWDIEAHFSAQPEAGGWSWRETDGA